MMQIILEIYRLKKKLVLAAGLLLALNIAMLAVTTWYLSPTVAEKQARWNELSRAVVQAGRNDANAVYRQGTADLDKLRARIPLKRQFPRVLGDILEAASSNGVSTGNITYKPQTVKDEKLLAYGITFNAGGSYAALKSFLADLLKDRELVVVDALSFTNPDPYAEAVTMELRLTVYLREEP